MTIEQAATELEKRLFGQPWFTAVGVGERNDSPVLYLYIRPRSHAEVDFVKNGWNGYPVEVKKMNTPRTVTA